MVIESFTGVRSGNLLSLRSAMLACLSAPWREYQVAGHQYEDRRSGTDRDGWLNVEIALRDLVANARRVLLGSLSDRLDELTLSRYHQFGPATQHFRISDPLDQRPLVKINQ